MSDSLKIDWGSRELSPHIREKLEVELASAEAISKGKNKISHPGFKQDAEGEPEGVIQTPEDFDDSYHASTIILVKDCGDFLNKTYPGWAWVIQVNQFGHMIEIFNHHLHPTYGYRIRMEDIMNDPKRKAIKQAGGEILERFDMARMGLNDKNKANLAAAPRDMVGNCIPHIDDLPDKKAATQAEIARGIANGTIKVMEVNGQKVVRIKK